MQERPKRVYVTFYVVQVERSQIIDDLTHPTVTEEPENVKNSITIHSDPYAATMGTHAIVLCTEWDEFMVRKVKLSSSFFSTSALLSIYESE